MNLGHEAKSKSPDELAEVIVKLCAEQFTRGALAAHRETIAVRRERRMAHIFHSVEMFRKHLKAVSKTKRIVSLKL